MASANPSYEVPTAAKIRDEIIRMADSEKEKIKEEIVDIRHVALSLDGWSGPKFRIKYLGILMHYVDRQGKLVTRILGLEPITTSETSEEIARIVDAIITKAGLTEKVAILTSDRGSNMVRAASLLGMRSINCAAHLVHNAVQKINDTNPTNELLQKIREFARKMARSASMWDTFGKSTNRRKPRLDVPTRWDSTFAMICDFMDSYDTVCGMDDHYKLTSEEILFLSALRKLLSIFNFMTKMLSAEDCHVSTILAFFKWGEENVKRMLSLTPELDCIHVSVELILNNYWRVIYECPNHLVAAYLNPKTLQSLSPLQSLQAKSEIVKEIQSCTVSMQSYYSIFDAEILGSSENVLNVDLELKTYEAIVASGVAKNISLYHFWMMQHQNLPSLHEQGLKWCPVPGSSVSVERLFSKLGVIYGNKRRGRLLPSVVESLVFVHDGNLGDIVERMFPCRYTIKYAEKVFDMARLEVFDPIGKPCVFDESDVDEESDDNMDF